MILYFTAAWCGPCKMFKPVVQQVSSELGVSIDFVDVDQQQDMVTKYKINSVPTIIVELGGITVYRHTGVMPKGELSKVLSQFR